MRVENIFTHTTIEKIGKYIDNIADIVPQMRINIDVMKFAGKDVYASVIGVDNRFFLKKKIVFANGYAFTPSQIEHNEKIVILANGVVVDGL